MEIFRTSQTNRHETKTASYVIWTAIIILLFTYWFVSRQV